VLTDIQIQTAHRAGIKASILERSPQLLGRAIAKYFEYLAPTETEIALMIDLAKYTCDAVTGSHYLPQEMRAQRMQQFWDRLNTLSETTTEDVVDNCMYVAARISWKLGVPKVIGLLKNLKGASDHLAERFIRHFDQVIQDNPIMITPEGELVAVATKDASWREVIARAIWGPPKNEISGFNGLMNFLESEEKINKQLEKEFNSDKVAKMLEVNNEKPIKRIHKEALKPPHIFSEEHKANEILLAGRRETVINRCLDLIKGLNNERVLVERGNEIRTVIKNQKITIRIHIKDGTAMSINIFPNFSDRVIGKLFELF